jgi:hypothetical protein
MAGSCFAMVLGLLAWGCAGKAGNEVALDTVSGKHPANWIQVHFAEYAAKPDECRTCHGSTSDPALAGGITKVSCFTCHPKGVNHPAGWADPMQHGRNGAQLAPNPAESATNILAMSGFAKCTKCHGSSYDNGPALSCKTCHTKAPHPGRPWTGTTLSQPNHVQTDIANAPECAKCHAGAANSTLKPLSTPPAGTAPGCFNGTLCHTTRIR